MPDRIVGSVDKPEDPLIGRTLAGKYRILDTIARGGMGQIYRAEQIPLGRIVAVKVLSVKFQADEDPAFENRFFLEAATLARLKHANTVTVFDYGHLEDTFYMVMEFVEGKTLSSILTDGGPLPPDRALRIAYEIARSLTEAHGHGIVHRDLKPANIMVSHNDEGETVKVVDFGIVKVLEDTGMTTITRPDRMVGSPRYMAPEQIRKTEIDGRTDIYALGVMLFEMMTGQPPYKGTNSVKTLIAHVQDPIPAMADKTDRPIPADVEALVRRCLQKKPENRFPDIVAFKKAVKRVLTELGHRPMDTMDGEMVRADRERTGETLAIATDEVPMQPPPRRGLMAVGIAILFMLTIIAVGVGYLAIATVNDPRPPAPAEPVGPVIRAPGGAVEAPPPVPASHSTLWISSKPVGAEVWEADSKLGVTPFTVEVSLRPDDAPRVFELRLEGYHPARVEQGYSTQAQIPRDVVLLKK